MGFKAKIKTSSPRLLNAWLLFATVLVIGVVYVLYSVYVNSNEKRQIEKRFRVLAQIGKNIVDKEKGFKKIAENATKRKKVEQEINALKSFKRIEILDIFKILEGSEDKKVFDKFYKDMSEEIEKVNKILKVDKEESLRGKRVLMFYPGDKDGHADNYQIYAQAKDFFEPLERKDVFDEFMVIKEKSGDSSEPKGKYAILYHTLPGDIDISELKDLKSNKQGIECGGLKDVEISKKKYKLFFQPIILDNGRKWYVGGLTDSKKFKRETGKLESGIILPFLLIFSIFILSIPYLKLFLMSKFEQLDIRDVVLTYISIILGVIALVVFCLFIFQAYDDSRCVKKSLSDLAVEIKEDFTDELRKAYNQLSKYNSLDFKIFTETNCYRVKDVLSDPKFEEENPPEIESPLADDLRPSIYKLFKGAYWMDSGGQQVLQFSTRNDGGGLVNLKHRKYFQDAGKWRLPEKESLIPIPKPGFMLESITSVTSGEKLAALSMRSKSEMKKEDKPVKVAAMSTQLTSVIDTIMPAGYGFCIIDQTGGVWFHSNTERNLQENFKDEVENDEDLSSAIYSRRAKLLDLNYQNISHKCFVMPVPDIPLYIVTFHDFRYTSAIQGTVFLYTCFLTILLAAFNVLHFIIAAWCNYRKSLLEKKFDLFGFLRPLKKSDGAYKHLFLSNLLILIFFIAFKIIYSTKGAETFLFCISTTLFAFVYNYYTITRKKNHGYPLNKFKRLLFFSLGFLLLIYLVARLTLDRFTSLALYQVILFLFIGLIALNRYVLPGIYRKVITPRLVDKYLPNFRSFLTGRSYIYFFLSWLILVWVTPVIMFYIDAYNLENKVAVKHLQVKLAEDIEKRNSRINTLYEEMISAPDNSNVRWTKDERKKLGIYAGIINDTEIETDCEKFSKAERIADNKFNKIAGFFRPPMNRVAAERGSFVFPRASDNSRNWRKKGDRFHLQYTVKISQGSTHGEDETGGCKYEKCTDNRCKDKIYIASTVNAFKIPWGIPFLMALIIIFLILTLAYYMIRFFGRMIYGLGLLEFETKERTYQDAQDEIRESLEAGSSMILYCQSINEMEYCEEVFDDKAPAGIEASSIDINSGERDKELEEVLQGKANGIVYLKNFELYSNDIQGNLEKTKFLIRLLRSPKVRAVIPTFIPLTEMIVFYEEKLAAPAAQTKKGEPANGEAKSQKEIIDLLNEANNCLIPLYAPLKQVETGKEEITDKETEAFPWLKEEQHHYIIDLIGKESKPSVFFKKIKWSIYKYYEELIKNQEPLNEKLMKENEERIILKIQDLSRHYYNRLLDSCTREEKYILYDIARDMLVNTNNSVMINILLKKGLLNYNGGFRLMNESFRNFVLTSIDPDDLKDYARALYPKWKSYKAPLLLIAFGLAVFLAFQENLLSNVDAIITTAVGGIAILTRFSGLFFNFPKSGGK